MPGDTHLEEPACGAKQPALGLILSFVNHSSFGAAPLRKPGNLARPLMPTLQPLSPARLTVEQTGAADREAAYLFLS